MTDCFVLRGKGGGDSEFNLNSQLNSSAVSSIIASREACAVHSLVQRGYVLQKLLALKESPSS